MRPNPDRLPVQLEQIADALLALYDLTAEAARAGAKQARRGKPLRNFTLHPGAATPLWNELIKQVRSFLGKRGSKVRLARYLGISRQRLHLCLKGRSCLDAERTLLLFCWLTARQHGRDLDL